MAEIIHKKSKILNNKSPEIVAILKELQEISGLQLQVWMMKSDGYTEKEITEKLGVSSATIERYCKAMSQTEFVQSMREHIISLRPLILRGLVKNLAKAKEVTVNACLKGMRVYEEGLSFGKGDGISSASDDDLRKLILGYLFGKKEELKPEEKAEDKPV